MATLPDYLQDQTEDAILRRMLDILPSELDKAEGSFVWDALAPAALELAQAAVWAQEVLRRGFASTSYGAYLDLRCEEHGLTRRPAVKAAGRVVFTGTSGTVVPAGTRVATPADRVTGTSTVEFATQAAVMLDETGSGSVPVEAVEAGTLGNVASGAISLMMTPVSGVAGVVNVAATEGGIDTESDEALRSRYLQKVRSPSAGGNKADYVNWALEVSGVGGVSVVPIRYGPGTVSVAIIDEQKQPAGQTLVDAVQAYIAPVWTAPVVLAQMMAGGFGVTSDVLEDQPCWKMAYDAAGEGVVSFRSDTLLQQPGQWQLRLPVQVSDTAAEDDLLQIGVWNLSANDWAKRDAASSGDALETMTASDLAAIWTEQLLPVYWDGQDQLETRVIRLSTDTVTDVWVGEAVFHSQFSTANGEGKAPVGARVIVEGAAPVPISITASLSVASGYNSESVRAAVRQQIETYTRSLAFTEDNDVRIVRIGQAILDTPGVRDYDGLLVNGGTGNIEVGVQEVAVLGSVVLI